jgi:hypothetical protein
LWTSHPLIHLIHLTQPGEVILPNIFLKQLQLHQKSRSTRRAKAGAVLGGAEAQTGPIFIHTHTPRLSSILSSPILQSSFSPSLLFLSRLATEDQDPTATPAALGGRLPVRGRCCCPNSCAWHSKQGRLAREAERDGGGRLPEVAQPRRNVMAARAPGAVHQSHHDALAGQRQFGFGGWDEWIW